MASDNSPPLPADTVLDEALAALSLPARRLSTSTTTFDRLPARTNTVRGDPVRETLRRLGFLIHEEKDGVLHLTPPNGWRLMTPPHSLWTDLVDQDGHKRGSIFSETSYYDRSPRIEITPRFTVREVYLDDNEKLITGTGEVGYSQWVVHDLQTKSFSYRHPPSLFVHYASAAPHITKAALAEKRLATECCIAWLDTAYPDWRKPDAYWE
jgi:hypothetical protein